MAERDELSPIASAVGDFVQLESAAGILLLAAAALAALVANSPLASFYDALLETTVAVQVGTSSINKPLPLWINAGHMAIWPYFPCWSGSRSNVKLWKVSCDHRPDHPAGPGGARRDARPGGHRRLNKPG